jgi:hypothetical protein
MLIEAVVDLQTNGQVFCAKNALLMIVREEQKLIVGK